MLLRRQSYKALISSLTRRVKHLEEHIGFSSNGANPIPRVTMVCKACGRRPLPDARYCRKCGGGTFVSQENYLQAEENAKRSQAKSSRATSARDVCTQCGLARHKTDTCSCRRCGSWEFCTPRQYKGRGGLAPTMFVDITPGQNAKQADETVKVLTYCPKCHGVQRWRRKVCRRCDVPIVTFENNPKRAKELEKMSARLLDRNGKDIESARALDTRARVVSKREQEARNRTLALDRREIRVKDQESASALNIDPHEEARREAFVNLGNERAGLTDREHQLEIMEQVANDLKVALNRRESNLRRLESEANGRGMRIANERGIALDARAEDLDSRESELREGDQLAHDREQKIREHDADLRRRERESGNRERALDKCERACDDRMRSLREWEDKVVKQDREVLPARRTNEERATRLDERTRDLNRCEEQTAEREQKVREGQAAIGQRECAANRRDIALDERERLAQGLEAEEATRELSTCDRCQQSVEEIIERRERNHLRLCPLCDLKLFGDSLEYQREKLIDLAVGYGTSIREARKIVDRLERRRADREGE